MELILSKNITLKVLSDNSIVRGYYMFMVGFDLDTRSYSTYLTSIIAIPTGIKILNWLATIWSSCFSSITPLYLQLELL